MRDGATIFFLGSFTINNNLNIDNCFMTLIMKRINKINLQMLEQVHYYTHIDNSCYAITISTSLPRIFSLTLIHL
jgi:hypothetical protein